MARIAALRGWLSFDQAPTTLARSGHVGSEICARICVWSSLVPFGNHCACETSAFGVEGSNPFARSILIIKDLRTKRAELPQKVTTHLPAFAPVLRICRCLEAPAFWQKVLVRGRQLQHKAQRIVGLEIDRFGPEDVGGHARFGDNGMPQVRIADSSVGVAVVNHFSVGGARDA